MSVAEMKKEINAGLNHLPDKVVEQVYAMVKQAETLWGDKTLTDEGALERLFDRYDDIFKKLSQ